MKLSSLEAEGMRSLSKVIKSYRANVASPITIVQNRPMDWLELVEELAEEIETMPELADLSEAPEVSEEESIAELKANAQSAAEEILRETEAMVKELLANAKVKAEEILADARVQAEMELTTAEQGKEEIQAQAHQTGYQAGYAAGKLAIDEELSQLRLEATHHLELAKAKKQQIIDESEGEIVELALAIAEKVIRSQVASDSEVVKLAVQAALGKVADREEVVVKVNPADLDEIMGIQEQLWAQSQGISRFKVVSDPLISQGGCVIETPCGTVDGRIERQLSEIKEALLEVS